MLMPGRRFSSDKYRYGFNGKERDQETTTYDYGLRILSPALGRFLSVDPLSAEYPWNSSYAYAENDVIRSIDLEGAEKYVRTHYYTQTDFKNGSILGTTTDDVWKCKTDICIGTQQTDKQIAAHNAITYRGKPLPDNGTFVYFEFAPQIGKTNYAKYTYTDANGKEQIQYFSQADIQFRFEEIEEAKKQLSKDYNLFAALVNLAGAGWLAKTELQAASGELKAAVNTTESKFLGGAKGDLYSKKGILEGNHAPTMNSMELSGFKIKYNEGSAFQMLYEEHRAFVSTGSGKAAVAFRNQEAGLLSQGKFMEAFDLNAQRVRAAYGNKYNDALNQAREYYKNNIVPQLQEQLQQRATNH